MSRLVVRVHDGLTYLMQQRTTIRRVGKVCYLLLLSHAFFGRVDAILGFVVWHAVSALTM